MYLTQENHVVGGYAQVTAELRLKQSWSNYLEALVVHVQGTHVGPVQYALYARAPAGAGAGAGAGPTDTKLTLSQPSKVSDYAQHQCDPQSLL